MCSLHKPQSMNGWGQKDLKIWVVLAAAQGEAQGNGQSWEQESQALLERCRGHGEDGSWHWRGPVCPNVSDAGIPRGLNTPGPVGSPRHQPRCPLAPASVLGEAAARRLWIAQNSRRSSKGKRSSDTCGERSKGLCSRPCFLTLHENNWLGSSGKDLTSCSLPHV